MFNHIDFPEKYRQGVVDCFEALLEEASPKKRKRGARELRTVARNVELGIFNFAVRDCAKKKRTARWDEDCFVHAYQCRHRALAVVFEKRPELLIAVRDEVVSGEALSAMDHMHFDEQRWREIHHDIEMRKCFTSKQEATTSEYVCSKCDSSEITYRSDQVRSLDEGASVFYTCLNCGHRWKDL